MPEFVLNRNYVLDGKGHKIRFVKGQPIYVPPEMTSAAAAIGAEAIDGDFDVLPPEDVPEEQLTQEDREVLMNAAFDTLIARNEREDFGGDGRPAMAALKEIVKFSFTRKERDLAFQKYRESKAE